ncbi:MAG: ADP-ribosylglycohydrolase family protein [Deltaproteobacteria bacterium]|nr:ADP-ribosylglycohydrolase family protein [Deltaproteobacteria bacterium]
MDLDKAKGIIYGLVVGDALGRPAEFLHLESIKENYGENGIQDLPEPALYTDDTQMSVAIAEALVKSGEKDVESIMEAVKGEFIKWLHSPENNRAPGRTCLTGEEGNMKGRTNFDRYLQDQLKDPDFAARFKKAGEAWDLAIQLAALRKESGWSQKELAIRVGTSQQQISRLESPNYEGHSLSMIRRVAEALGATVRVAIERGKRSNQHAIAESSAKYKSKR